MAINWDEAPDGATHCAADRVYPWLKLGRNGQCYFYNGRWVRYYMQNIGRLHVHGAVPRPEKHQNVKERVMNVKNVTVKETIAYKQMAFYVEKTYAHLAVSTRKKKLRALVKRFESNAKEDNLPGSPVYTPQSTVQNSFIWRTEADDVFIAVTTLWAYRDRILAIFKKTRAYDQLKVYSAHHGVSLEELIDRFITNVAAQGVEGRLERIALELYTVETAFTWHSSDEGSDYWYRIDTFRPKVNAKQPQPEQPKRIGWW